jgi:hypothetical protein
MRRLAKEVGFEGLHHKSEEDLGKLVDDFLDNGIGNPRLILKSAADFIDRYGGSFPSYMWKNIHDFDTAREMLMEIEQVGPQKATNIYKNKVRHGFLEPEDPYDFPPKIDVHMYRLSYGNGVIKLEINPEPTIWEPLLLSVKPFEKPLEETYREILRTKRINPINVDDTKWVIGSNYCQEGTKKPCYTICPLDCIVRPKLNRRTYLVIPGDMRKPYQTELC